ncbi:cadherin domain-containing protein [Labrenzia sp. R4_1]|uniref:beta strand repeat-containing protein n=1 Tax=Labrenzia sp. R4_1 TaxID=2821106 RepID=UPI001AD96AC1|nr:cadherin domain-containing protein [Labrenzia sp. R4_1]MBO9427330.1 cadherin domain-containing protein [Labrenzia sp. R4_1]
MFGFDESRSGAQNAAGDPIDQPNNSGTPSDNPDDSPSDPDAPDIPVTPGSGGGTPADTFAPLFTSPDTFIVEENTTTVGEVTANESATFLIVGGADESLFQINPSSGDLTFLTAPDYENPADSGADNTYNIEIEARDSSGNQSTQEITITVGNQIKVGTDFGTIQLAINAAQAGDTIVVPAGDYIENLVIDKAITIKALNGGDVNIAPASGVAVTFATGVDGDVTLDGLDLVGNGTSTRGIDVTPGANIGTLTFTNGEINGFTDRGIFSTDNADPTNLLAMGALVVSNSTLSDNGNGGGNTAHIKLFGFNGDATFENIGLIGETGSSAIGSRPDNAIELIGGLNAPNSANPAPANSPDIGTVTFSGVTVSGEYHKNPIGIFNFGELDGLSITGLDLSGAVSSWKLFNIDGVTETNIDGSSYGITFPNTTEVVAELQGEKSANQGTVDTTITGTSSSDQLNGKEGNDILNGGDGNDILIGGDGNNQLNGGDGIDAAIFFGNFQDYTTELLANGEFRVEDANGVNTLTNVENLVFADAVYNLELEALTRYDQDITPEIIFGSGNINGSFTTSTVDNTEHSLELGIRGKLRFNDSNQPENTFNSNGDGTYTFETGSPTGGAGWVDANTPVWSFEFAVNTNVDGGSGKALNDYTFLLEMDGDPSSATDFGDSFDPIIVTIADHAIGNNATGNGDGVSAANEVDYANLIDTNNVAQQSWTYEFFDDSLSQLATFDPTDEGIYTIKLSAFDGGDLVNVVSIDIVTEAPLVP